MPDQKAKKELRIHINKTWHDVIIEYQGKNEAVVTVDNEPIEIKWETKKTIDQKSGTPQSPAIQKELLVTPAQSTNAPPTNSKTITAPMPGKIIGISVKPNDQVSIGDEICILEAMKMQQIISASVSGTVKNVLVQPGAIITAGQAIVVFE
jgi:biotin carboxyl carrier protein